MACRYKKRLWENNWCPMTCMYCTLEQESHCEYNKATNADRIRAMSDEELADFLGEYRFCDICDEWCEACTYHGDCDKRLLDWLKQPAEDERWTPQQ